jgi:hypothetical protein
MAGMHARSRGSASGILVLFPLALAFSPSAAAQATGCDFPVPWANARKWTGIFSSTATGSGGIPTGGTYSITQTFSGTVTLDTHIPLEDTFTGNVKFTVSAQEHYEFPNPGGPPNVIDVVANGSVDSSTDGSGAVLAFDFSACKYYFYIAPRDVQGTINGNPIGYVLGPTGNDPELDLLDAIYLRLPTASLPDLSDGATFQAQTGISAGFATPPLDWTVTLDLTPEPCPILDVPLFKQAVDPWGPDTYDKFFETSRRDPTAPVASAAGMELIKFPIGISQGDPAHAEHLVIPLSGTDNSLNGLADALGDAAQLVPPPEPPGKIKGTLLRFNDPGLNSLQLLATPVNPKTNILGKISALGCYETCVTMIFDFFGGSLNPRDMNDWLNDQPDGFKGHGVNSPAVNRLARQKNVKMSWVSQVDKNDDVVIEKYICAGNPVMLKVTPQCVPPRDPCQHFVVATGKTVSNGELTWTIKDPGFNNNDLGGYGGVYQGFRLWAGPGGQPAAIRESFVASATDESRLVLAAAPSFQLTVTDPQGRQLQCLAGVPVPVANPIPDATCVLDQIQNDDDLTEVDTMAPTIVVEAPAPASGAWQVDVSTIDPENYTMDAIAYDSDGGVSRASATRPGPAVGAHYMVSYSSVPGYPVALTAPPVPDGGSPAPDGGTVPDAGSAPPDGGATGGTGGTTSSGGAGSHGGCGTGDAGVLAFIAFMFFAIRTRALRRGFGRRRSE